VSDGQGVAMPRITVTRWLSPWVTARASVGSDLLNEGAMSASLMLSGHLRGFDGARSR
jgi:hypothetical protein